MTLAYFGGAIGVVGATDSFVGIVVTDGCMVVVDGNGGSSIAKEIKLYFPSNILVLSCFDKRLLFASLLAFEANITLTSVVFCTKEKQKYFIKRFGKNMID